MSLDTDLAQFCAKLDAAIDATMQNEVTTAAKATMMEAIETEVYDRYDPTEYIRRGQHGGLQDPDNMLANYYPKDKELHLVNVAREDGNTIPGSKRFIAPVIESGYGYTWTKSRIYKRMPFPRPFHAETERMLGKNGIFEDALNRGLRLAGFDAHRE